MAPGSEHRIDFRRIALLVIGIGGLALGLANQWTAEEDGGRSFATNSAFRVGVVMLALWLALPTLNKPMRWLPPGAAVLCLLVIGAIAAQPRLLLLAIPAGGALLTVAWLVRLFRVHRSRRDDPSLFRRPGHSNCNPDQR